MHRRNGRSDESELHAIVSRMRATREELPLDVNATTRAIKRTLDWRTYVRKYPWVCVGLAAGIGYLIVPKGRKRDSRYNAEALRAPPERASSSSSPAKSLIAMAAPVVARTLARVVVPRIIDSIRQQPPAAVEEPFEAYTPHRPR